MKVKVDALNKKVMTETGEIIEFDTVMELLVYVRDKETVHADLILEHANPARG